MNNTILVTSNGGTSWTTQSSGVVIDPEYGCAIYGLSFLDADHGWAVAKRGLWPLVLSTADGGLHWVTQQSFDHCTFLDICFADASHGWVAGQGLGPGIVGATSDGGVTWSARDPLGAEGGGTAPLRHLSFPDAGRGWAVGEGAIIATRDGGTTWTLQTPGMSTDLYGVDFVDATHGWAVGSSGTILVTADGGWQTPVVSAFEPASGGAGTVVTITGHDFTDATAVTFGGVVAWDFIVDSDTQVRAVVPSGASSGKVAVTTPSGTGTSLANFTRIGGGGTWGPQVSGTTKELNDVDFTDATHGWVAGAAGTILVTSDAGGHWAAQSSGTTKELSGVAFPNNANGWAVGADGTVLSTGNGGGTWSPQVSGTSTHLTAVAFPDALKGWALGRDGTIIATANGGGTWQTQRAAVVEALPVYYESISFADASHGCAVGYVALGQSARSPRLLVTGNGGVTWTDATSDLPGTALRGVTLLDASRGWTVGSGGSVAATADGGATWAAGTGAAGNLYGVAFADLSHGWVAGDDGDVYFRGAGSIHATTDGGATWTSQPPGTLSPLNDVEFVDTLHGWAVGAGGRIVATSNGGRPAPAVSVSAPTAASSWPSGSTQTVAWNLSSAVSGGEFRVSLVSAAGAWYVNKSVPAAAGQTSCSTQLIAAVPAGSYRAAVYWRPATGSGSWLSTAKSAAFTVTPINITVPSAATVWSTQATQAVSWNVNPAMTGGEFRVSLISSAGTWYVNKQVLAVPGRTSYSTSVNTIVPAGSYRAAVYWRATVGVGGFTATQKSAAFTIATLAITDPTAASSWKRLTTRSVVWTVNPALAFGEFFVWLVPASGAWHVNKQVLAVPGKTDYETSVHVSVPPGTYRAAVYWRPTVGSGSWVLAKKSATFTVTP